MPTLEGSLFGYQADHQPATWRAGRLTGCSP